MKICIWCKQSLSGRTRVPITNPYQPSQTAEIHCDCVIEMVGKLCDINMALDQRRAQEMKNILEEIKAKGRH